MPVRSVLLSSITVVAAIAGAASSTLQAQTSEPIKADPLRDGVRARATQPATFAVGESSNLKDRVASATRPLDLHKLSMSDFGDVELPR